MSAPRSAEVGVLQSADTHTPAMVSRSKKIQLACAVKAYEPRLALVVDAAEQRFAWDFWEAKTKVGAE